MARLGPSARNVTRTAVSSCHQRRERSQQMCTRALWQKRLSVRVNGEES